MRERGAKVSEAEGRFRSNPEPMSNLVTCRFVDIQSIRGGPLGAACIVPCMRSRREGADLKKGKK